MLSELEGDALLVPEPAALGGFGYEIDGALYNIDTLKFFEALIALERGAVLDEIRAPGRRLVWEIGAGWGGFAYQFKTLFPDVTYVIVDLPELFQFSATYLTTLFPEAKVVHGNGDVDALADWESVDFAFVPTHASDSLAGPPDLTLNMVSFQEMTTEQVDDYARLAWELGCPFIYSFNRDRPVEPESSVREVLDRYYWLHEVPLLELRNALRLSLPERAVVGRSALGPRLVVRLPPRGRMAARLDVSDVSVVLGVPLYGSGEHLQEALESLLAQTQPGLALVLCDDGPGDGARAIVEAVAGGDSRVTYRRNERRLGLVENWRRTFEVAGELHPEARYFGWASDHDACHPRWAERLVDALDRSPAAVLAYGRTYQFDCGPARRARGGPFRHRRRSRPARAPGAEHCAACAPATWSTASTAASPCRRSGVIRRLLLPDRLLLSELSVQGEFRLRAARASLQAHHRAAQRSPGSGQACSGTTRRRTRRLPWWARAHRRLRLGDHPRRDSSGSRHARAAAPRRDACTAQLRVRDA